MRACRLSAAVLLLLCLAGCNSPDPVLPDSADPFVYVVLDKGASANWSTRDQYAVVLTTGTPVLSPCRAVQEIEMTRARDGMPFAWRIQPECLGGAGPDLINVLAESCCLLPEDAPPDSLGVDDLRGGERYELEILTDGVRVTGSLIMPDTFSIRITTLSEGRRAAAWPRVAGAAGYLVNDVLSTDTISPLAASQSLVVRALDANLWAYLRDPTTKRAGIAGAFGVFGATSRAAIGF